MAKIMAMTLSTAVPLAFFVNSMVILLTWLFCFHSIVIRNDIQLISNAVPTEIMIVSHLFYYVYRIFKMPCTPAVMTIHDRAMYSSCMDTRKPYQQDRFVII